jgi:serine/threonine-protein phosphatase PP1 catalytic subunit
MTASPGSPIIAPRTFSRDQEYFGLVDKYKAADDPDKRCLSERLRRVRRKPGLDQLGDGAATPLPRTRGHVRGAEHRDGATSYLEAIQRLDVENLERRKNDLEVQRQLWEASLPKQFHDYLAYVSDETRGAGVGS